VASLSEVADSHRWIDVIAPTNDLPRLLGEADAVVSACGTSAWELCTLGIPSLLIAVADNQRRSLADVQSIGVALGIDAIKSASEHRDEIGESMSRLISEQSLRRALTGRCGELFDGAGKVRVVEAMERHQS
jgi:spore coat polysaccharide biosynthesis predicted glycosyltransferase SpsG